MVFDGIRRFDHAPLVDGPGRTYRNAVHAEVAFVEIDHDIAVVVHNRLDRTSHFERVAANADFRVNQVLFLRLAHLSSRNALSGALLGLILEFYDLIGERGMGALPCFRRHAM